MPGAALEAGLGFRLGGAMDEQQVTPTATTRSLRTAVVALVATIALVAIASGCSSSADRAGSTAPTTGARSDTSAQPDGTGDPLHVVVLGDSYSAGNSAGSYEGPAECFRSPYNYGHDVAQDLGRRTGRKVVVRTEACSGATSKDV